MCLADHVEQNSKSTCVVSPTGTGGTPRLVVSIVIEPLPHHSLGPADGTCFNKEPRPHMDLGSWQLRRHFRVDPSSGSSQIRPPPRKEKHH